MQEQVQHSSLYQLQDGNKESFALSVGQPSTSGTLWKPNSLYKEAWENQLAQSPCCARSNTKKVPEFSEAALDRIHLSVTLSCTAPHYAKIEFQLR